MAAYCPLAPALCSTCSSDLPLLLLLLLLRLLLLLPLLLFLLLQLLLLLLLRLLLLLLLMPLLRLLLLPLSAQLPYVFCDSAVTVARGFDAAAAAAAAYTAPPHLVSMLQLVVGLPLHLI